MFCEACGRVNRVLGDGGGGGVVLEQVGDEDRMPFLPPRMPATSSFSCGACTSCTTAASTTSPMSSRDPQIALRRRLEEDSSSGSREQAPGTSTAAQPQSRHDSSCGTSRSTRSRSPTTPRGRSAPVLSREGAVMELQYDEYGAGNPHRLHAQVLMQNNVMSLFGLNRRLRRLARLPRRLRGHQLAPSRKIALRSAAARLPAGDGRVLHRARRGRLGP